MFKVNSEFQYIHHFVSSRDIANAVKDDLASREDCQHPELINVEEVTDNARWDPGGSLWVGDKTHIFSLPNINIEVYLQHVNAFIAWVNRAKEEVRDWQGTKYHKIHSGYLFCICLSPDEIDKLIEQFNDVNLTFSASVSEEERSERMAMAGILSVAKVKDSDGNEQIAVIKPKKKPLLN